MLRAVAEAVRALLRLRGAAALPALDEHVLPFAAKWIAERPAPAAVATALTLLTHSLRATMQHPAAAAGSCTRRAEALVTAALEAIDASDDDGGGCDETVRKAAAQALGVAAELSARPSERGDGEALSPPTAAAVATKLSSVLRAEGSRWPQSLAASEQAAAALGKLVAALAAGGGAADDFAAPVASLWLAWLPLRTDAEEGHASLQALIGLLRTDAGLGLVVGPGAERLPLLLAALAAAYDSDAAGGTISADMRGLVREWRATRPSLLQACAAALPEQPRLRQKLAHLLAA